MYGKKIKELRCERGLTQKELADALQTSQINISRLELEITDISSAMIIKVCKYFNVTSDFLLGLED